ncbi:MULTISPECIES: TonB-dependent receptor [Rhodanobacter]|uniref:TonB-dependent receptor n=1 Tax=Rhodanobacter TaxID=75309 RepID=UPI0009DB82D9|nr:MULTISPECIES: TonB-dependent receptor [Rhodanobacter]UJJ50971.1 TonB-dependent receptor [Rhodanobacter denitrificans]UJM93684.1 TonB-dependent receptor [Rhodanobacter denitrificans]UJM97215.1 TonB-dependent receptor [Rhodanobacter denitrificans]UJN19957.1 TonB-dependent receptor [Rhodanobacter denitrificans]
MFNESKSFGRQGARKRGSAAARGVKGLRRLPALGLLSLAIALAQAAPVHAQNVGDSRDYAISSQPLSTALNQLALATDRQIMVPPELVRGRTAPALAGHYSLDAALRHLLAGSGLTYEVTGTGTVVVKQTPPNPPPRSTKPAPATSQKADQKPEPTTLQGVTVTGTRIRGGTTPSPVITIGAENIREEGFTDLGEVIRSIPQNFSGGQNPGAGSGNIAGAGDVNQNLTGGSGLNLRGLGPDATLTLLNGRRMTYGGYVQAVDISAIPIEAVERVEIVTDGASAIYGSDAVGGVANVILKRDFEGVSVGMLNGSAAHGGLATREYTATAGTTWANGGLIATYKYSDADPIYASERRYTDHIPEPATLYPGSDLHSGLLSAHQALGENVELRLDALRTERGMLQYYNWSRRNHHIANKTTTSLISPGIEFSLPQDWTLSIGGTWGKDEAELNHTQRVIATGVSTLVESICACNESRSYEVGAEGPLFALPGGDARLAVGTGYRKNDFLMEGSIPGADPYGLKRNGESAKFAYAEINLPLIGPEQGVTGVHRLLLTGAMRGEDYDSFGNTTTPKLGLIYGPSADFTLKASWGKSFKAPTLLQRYYKVNAYLYSPRILGGSGYPADATTLLLYGGNPDLKPERARTWTTSLAFHPERLPGLQAELTWFDIDYTDRVVQPITNSSQTFSNPDYAAFIDFSPTAGEQAKAIAAASSFANYAGVDYDPDKVVAIVKMQFTNVARQRIKGFDLTGSYGFDAGAGRLTLRGSATWLNSTQQVIPTQDPADLSGTLFNPPKVSSRIGAVWNRGGFTASTFVNYKGGVTNRTDGVKSTSFTTLDATLRYNTGERGDAWSNLDLALSLDNLLDREPPLYTPASAAAAANVPPYDQTNYSAIGRYLNLSISKRW